MGRFATSGPHGALPVRLADQGALLRGRRVLVTGAARGLGRAVAEAVVAAGGTVWLADRLEDEPLAGVAALGAAGWTAADLSDADAAEAVVAAADEGLEGVDGVANIAGIVLHHDPLAIPAADWARLMTVNVTASYLVAASAARRMRAAGRPGSIVNTASEAGKVGHVDSLAYSASKAAVISMTRMLSQALAADDVNVNCVCPGGLDTAMLREVAEVYAARVGGRADEVLDELVAGQLGRRAAVAEVAQVFVFLLSDAARTVRGQAVNADGGDTPY
ncbi:SDR family NAD(P)-dependent oxidoreductase [Amnibacterium endophyticum]|uniref:SDR family NAD(P)-dependent oxidoreductase n=1 Tax=Amnibacterium endophyticum TaxID=2109337 RepID=A0ABW4LH62_9MICO